ncbi:hypothetical protein LCGC14_1790350 [marine sediment metagenome]|uniref:Uncharacterized protein n=1 Tax=marine sediment metagenome TaxID=412755 RepID=A0A0F9GSR1_9ZZZZ
MKEADYYKKALFNWKLISAILLTMYVVHWIGHFI